MPTNLDRARIIARDVELLSVSLADAQLSSSIDPMSLPEQLELSNKYRARFETDVSETRHVRVFVDFDFSASGDSGSAKGRPVLSLKATYLLVYRLPPNKTYPKDSYGHFAWLNGPYSAWPYWRELVQSVSGRVGLAGVVIPVFRPQVVSIAEQASRATAHPQTRIRGRLAKRKQ